MTRAVRRRLRACAWGLLLCLGLVRTAGASPLTLEAVLAHADQPHPELERVQAQVQAAAAERMLAESLRDFQLTLDASLRGGRNTVTHDYAADHLARLRLRKPLWDGMRYAANLEAAQRMQEARQLALLDVRAQRRLTLMARFFDVLLSDLQHAADTESMAVAYVRWDDAKHRAELGELAAPQLAELEAAYQALYVRQRDSARQVRESRARLAAAMNQPDNLPGELLDPQLKDNDRPLPEFESLLTLLQRGNPRLAMLRLHLAAATSRLAAARADDGPRLEFEAEAAAYSRTSTTRDSVRAGINFVWPLYDGRQHDARLAREQASINQLRAEYDQLWLELRQSLLETLNEIQHLREVERRAAEVEAHYRELALDRARAEYELELKTNLGTSMAQTQLAKVRRRAIEYRLALAWERLAGLLGGPLETVLKTEKETR